MGRRGRIAIANIELEEKQKEYRERKNHNETNEVLKSTNEQLVKSLNECNEKLQKIRVGENEIILKGAKRFGEIMDKSKRDSTKS